MDEAVRQALYGEGNDAVLMTILSLLLHEKNSGREMWPNPIDEPTLVSKFLRPLLTDGLAEMKAGQDALQIAQASFKR